MTGLFFSGSYFLFLLSTQSSNTCPVDRSNFDAIIVRNEINGNVLDRIEVQARNVAAFAGIDIDEVIINDETIICEVSFFSLVMVIM